MNFFASLAATYLGKYLVNNIDRVPGLLDRAIAKALEIKTAALRESMQTPHTSTTSKYYAGKAEVVGKWRDLLLEIKPKVDSLVSQSSQFLKG